MITELSTFIQEHKAAATVGAMWLTREAHVIWPALVSIFPYCRDNGGAIGIAKQFLLGKAEARPAIPQTTEITKPLEKV